MLEPVPAPIVTRFSIEAPPDTSFTAGGGRTGVYPLVSPDGRVVAFSARGESGQTHIWLRRLNASAAQPLPDTRGFNVFFWSSDSRFLAFVADGKLKKIAIDGGPSQTLADAESGLGGGSWSPTDVILLGRSNDGLVRVPAAGGPPQPVTRVAPGQLSHRFPVFLNDGRRFLYYAVGERAVYGASLDGGEPTLVLSEVDTTALPSPSGHILYVREGVLLVQPFDAASLQAQGAPLPIAEDVAQAYIPGFLGASISNDGTLVFGTSAFQVGEPQQLMWVIARARCWPKSARLVCSRVSTWPPTTIAWCSIVTRAKAATSGSWTSAAGTPPDDVRRSQCSHGIASVVTGRQGHRLLPVSRRQVEPLAQDRRWHRR